MIVKKLSLILALVPSLALAGEVTEPLPAKVQFNRDIRPILSDNCFACHGPDVKKRKAKLRLDLPKDVYALRDGITVIKPKDLKNSEIWLRITTKDKDDLMPPAKSNKSLTARQIALVKRWIEQGAKWEDHWSFVKPKSPMLPKVSDQAWIKNPIDSFTLARLDAVRLKPSPEADRQTLVRRVALDLTGLPPTLEQIDTYVNDKRPGAYERMVDGFLGSKAYGERMTLAWMDAARYGDSSVYHADGPRTMWPWRDWVINAYNNNMPFDQFTIEQLAGDLIPSATIYQKIASGFNRNNGTTDEGGVIAEEYRVEYAVDRVKTTSNVWLGLSMECCQCHEHKYDPISHKEYYQFYAFFNRSADKGMQTRKGNADPKVNVPDPVKEKKRAELNKLLAPIDAQLKSRIGEIEEPFQAWIKEETDSRLLDKKPTIPMDMLAHYLLDEKKGNKVADQIDPKRKGIIKGKAQWVSGKFSNGIKINRKNHVDLGNVGDFDRTEAFSYGCWVKPDDVSKGAPLTKMNDKNLFRGYDLFFTGGRLAVHIINKWPDNALKVITKTKLKNKQWSHIFATYDGSSKASGVKIYINGKEEPWTIEADKLTSGTIKTKAPLIIGRRSSTSPYAGIIDDVRLYKRQLSGAEVAALAGSDPIGPLLAVAADKRTKKQVQTLRTHYLNNIDKPYKKFTADKSKLQGQIQGLNKSNITVMVMGDQPKPRDTYILMRGHYASPDKKEKIEPGVPKVLGSLPKGAPANRLGLAQWLTAPEHPLTARVAVNRYWTMFFGRGIVSTVMDFGSQGKWPSHPKMLDWLATDFVKNGWDVKRTIKQILMSATYRQTSRISPMLKEKDALNILLARGPRFRLQGEFIRDTALAASGLLVNKVGGPSTKPPQPPGLWNAVSLNGGLRFVPDKGEKIYRRSMYIYWKRSSPHPGMRIFDAPTREKCLIQRARTNTPLQALYTLNGPQFVESARALAQRAMTQGGKTAAERITYAYRLATARKPSAATVATLTLLYNQELAKYQKDADSTKKLLAVGESKRDESLNAAEHAAWTIVSSVILNLDATLSRS